MSLKPRKPRVIVLTQFYEPEPAYKGQAFAEAVANAGYDVEVVTGFPNYPGGKIYDGYRLRPFQKSEINGIKITRLALYPCHDASKAGRIANYLTFSVSVFLYLTFFARRADLLYAYSPPATVGTAAATASLFRGFPVVVDIHDLWPDTLPSSGMLNNPRALALIGRICDWMYRRAQHVILHSKGFRERLLERGVPPEKTTAIIGWTNEKNVENVSPLVPENMRNLQGFKLLYAGNLGPAQALETVLEAAKRLQEAGEASKATFIFLGSGVSRDDLVARTTEMGLTNVIFLPRVSQSEVGAYLSAADALLVHLRNDPLFAITMPSKAQAYMLAGRPIVMGVAGEASELIETAQCGLSVPPEDPAALADSVRRLSAMSPSERATMGENGKAYYWQHLSMSKGMARFIEIFEKYRRR